MRREGKSAAPAGSSCAPTKFRANDGPITWRLVAGRRTARRHGDQARHSGGRLTYLLKLYVTGTSPRAETAIANLRRICEQELRGQYDLQIIDVLENPQVAEDDKILATPTLIKQLPPPLRRVIGDLSDKDKVLFGLEVRREANNPDSQRDV
jgi:circadian clock protein KaiB